MWHIDTQGHCILGIQIDVRTYTLTYRQDRSLEIHGVGGEEMVVRGGIHEKCHPFPCHMNSEDIPKLNTRGESITEDLE